MKRMLFMIGVVAMLLTSCSPFALVNSEVYNDADLSDYHTFRIVTPDEGSLPDGMQMVTYYNIAAAIRQQMVERGFTEDPNSNLLINIAVTTHRWYSRRATSRITVRIIRIISIRVPITGRIGLRTRRITAMRR